MLEGSISPPCVCGTTSPLVMRKADSWVYATSVQGRIFITLLVLVCGTLMPGFESSGLQDF